MRGGNALVPLSVVGCEEVQNGRVSADMLGDGRGYVQSLTVSKMVHENGVCGTGSVEQWQREYAVNRKELQRKRWFTGVGADY